MLKNQIVLLTKQMIYKHATHVTRKYLKYKMNDYKNLTHLQF